MGHLHKSKPLPPGFEGFVNTRGVVIWPLGYFLQKLLYQNFDRMQLGKRRRGRGKD